MSQNPRLDINGLQPQVLDIVTLDSFRNAEGGEKLVTFYLDIQKRVENLPDKSKDEIINLITDDIDSQFNTLLVKALTLGTDNPHDYLTRVFGLLYACLNNLMYSLIESKDIHEPSDHDKLRSRLNSFGVNVVEKFIEGFNEHLKTDFKKEDFRVGRNSESDNN